MITTPITREEFERINAARQLGTSRFARSFLKFDLAGMWWGVAWESESVPPIVAAYDSVWVGVDRYVAALEKSSGRFLILLVLPTPFQRLQRFDDMMLIVCETDVIVLNSDLSIRAMTNVGDVLSEVERDGDALMLTTLEGRNVKIRV